MFRPHMVIIRFFSLKVLLYKLREKGCDVEISHQIIILVCLCIEGYYITHIYIRVLYYTDIYIEDGCLLGVSPCRLVSGSRHEFNAFVLMANQTTLRSKSQ